MPFRVTSNGNSLGVFATRKQAEGFARRIQKVAPDEKPEIEELDEEEARAPKPGRRYYYARADGKTVGGPYRDLAGLARGLKRAQSRGFTDPVASVLVPVGSALSTTKRRRRCSRSGVSSRT